MDAHDNASMGVIVFCECKDGIEGIACNLNRYGLTERSMVPVGQADSRQDEGMKQTEQTRSGVRE